MVGWEYEVKKCKGEWRFGIWGYWFEKRICIEFKMVRYNLLMEFLGKS